MKNGNKAKDVAWDSRKRCRACGQKEEIPDRVIDQ